MDTTATSFDLAVLSAEGQIFVGRAQSITAPTTEGEVTILPEHEPLVATLAAGELVVRGTVGLEHIFVGGGALEVQQGKVRVLADTALRSDAIDEAAAEEARRRAEETLGSAVNEHEAAVAQAAFFNAIAQLRIAEKRRRHH